MNNTVWQDAITTYNILYSYKKNLKRNKSAFFTRGTK